MYSVLRPENVIFDLIFKLFNIKFKVSEVFKTTRECSGVCGGSGGKSDSRAFFGGFLSIIW